MLTPCMVPNNTKADLHTIVTVNTSDSSVQDLSIDAGYTVVDTQNATSKSQRENMTCYDLAVNGVYRYIFPFFHFHFPLFHL